MTATLEPALAEARRRLAGADRILLITHVNPDGDAVGSLLGLGLALRAAGRQAVFSCADPAPETFSFLAGFDEITTRPEGDFDLVVAVDASDFGRLGRIGESLGRAPDLQLDHHVTNDGFARINLVDVQAASTAELVAEALEPLGLELTQPVAECLLTGLVTDTLGFRTSSTTSRTLAIAQRLMNAGARLHFLYDQSLFKRSFAAVRLWAAGLERARLDGRIVWASLPLEARRTSGYTALGDADLINVLSSVREADVALIFVERPDGKVKVSWRAAPGINVARLAAQFGGGGHAPAAGAEVAGSLAEVEARVLAATRAILNHHASPEPT